MIGLAIACVILWAIALFGKRAAAWVVLVSLILAVLIVAGAINSGVLR